MAGPVNGPNRPASDPQKGSKKRRDPPTAQYGRPGGKPAADYKRAKVNTARDISAQKADAALKDGELDLQAFLEAREFEIRALEEGMRLSRLVNKRRAFQQVPRNLRRRTASHNVKRVPKRLRRRAAEEMAQDNTPTVTARRRKPRTTGARIRAETAKRLGVLAEKKRRAKLHRKKVYDQAKKAEDAEQMSIDGGTTTTTNQDDHDKGTVVKARNPRPKIRRNSLKPAPVPLTKFRTRQIDKSWLPTHIWHAKRARMPDHKSPLWRFAIPLTPNEKVYRATHRAQGARGAVVWDTSYMGTISLNGSDAGARRVLARLGVDPEFCHGKRGDNWRLGLRAWNGMLSRELKGPERAGQRRNICPAMVLWNPESSEDNYTPTDDRSKKRQRQLFIRVHPSAYKEVFDELLKWIKAETPRLYIVDLRWDIGSIELTGPASTELLLATLKPYPSSKEFIESRVDPNDTLQQHAHIFQSLHGLTNPASTPANSLLAFDIQDPRLHLPDKARAAPDDEAAQQALCETLAAWPADVDLAPSPLYSPDSRFIASRLPSQKALDRRRSQLRTPGSLKPILGQDPAIPIILAATRPRTGTQAQGSWTILAPRTCILALWRSIVQCRLSTGGTAQFGGLHELRQVEFERGAPSFPNDALDTDAGVAWETDMRARRLREWTRRPRSKRVNWATLNLGGGRRGEVGDGSACDFEYLFGLRPTDTGDAMEVDGETSPAAEFALDRMAAVSRAHFTALWSGTQPLRAALPQFAIVTVKLTLVGRGAMAACARIYSLPSTRAAAGPAAADAEVPATAPPPLRAQWLASGPRTAHPAVPDAATDLLGFVTTAAFSLSEGRPTGVGVLAAARVLAARERDVGTADRQQLRMCIVRNAGESVGRLARWELLGM